MLIHFNYCFSVIPFDPMDVDEEIRKDFVDEEDYDDDKMHCLARYPAIFPHKTKGWDMSISFEGNPWDNGHYVVRIFGKLVQEFPAPMAPRKSIARCLPVNS